VELALLVLVLVAEQALAGERVLVQVRAQVLELVLE
jgi:hypothetical protein